MSWDRGQRCFLGSLLRVRKVRRSRSFSASLPILTLPPCRPAGSTALFSRIRQVSGIEKASLVSSCRRSGRDVHRLDDERGRRERDRKNTRLNSSHVKISYAVFCL